MILSHIWGVALVEAKHGYGKPLKVYALINLNLEAWCVFTANVMTVVRILQIRNISTDVFQVEYLPKSEVQRYDYLVPRVRAAQRLGKGGSMKKPWAEIFESMIMYYDIYFEIDNFYLYILKGDPQTGWILVAWFDLDSR